MEKYTIGQIAKALGISTQLLRHYEALGLLDTKRDRKNQYRTYKTEDTKLLFQTIIYRAMGFSLKKINQMLKEETPLEVEKSLDTRINEIQQEIEELKGVQNEIKEYRDSLLFSESRQGCCWIEPDDFEFYRIMKKGSGYSIVGADDELLVSLQKKVPYVRQGFTLSLKMLQNPQLPFDYQYGVVMKKEDISRHCHQEDMSPYLIKLSGPIAKMILSLKPQNSFSRDFFRPFFEAVESKGYQPFGDCYGVARYVSFKEDADNLFEFLMPVKPLKNKDYCSPMPSKQ